MSIQTRIRVIKEAKTEGEAIAAYGLFVTFYETYEAKLTARINRSKRRDWTNDRVSRHKIQTAPSQAHAAIDALFGMGVVHKAISAHPFS